MQALAPSEREVVIAQLSESFAQDRLSLGEFEHRVAAAYRATTVADLTALTVDLTDRTDLAAGTRVAQSPYAGTSMMVGRVSAIWGNVERRDAGSVPLYLELQAIVGNVELDLRAALFAPGITEIAISAVMGNIEVKLPPDIDVENHAHSIVGSIKCQGREWHMAPHAAVSVVRVTGRAVLSSIAITVDEESVRRA